MDPGYEPDHFDLPGVLGANISHNKIRQLEQQLSERDEKIAELTQRLASREAQVQRLINRLDSLKKKLPLGTY